MKYCLRCRKSFDSLDWKCLHCGFTSAFLHGRPAFAPDLALENDGFHAEDFELLNRMEGGHFWFDARNRLIAWALGRFFPGAKNFFEIGCGDGYVLEWIEKTNPGLGLYGSEVYDNALDFAQKRLKQTALFQMDARKIPFKEEFDVMGAFDVLEHIREDEEVLAQMYQAVKKGGGILLSVPQHMFLWSDADKFSFHVRRYEARELREKVEKAGFQVVVSTSFVSFLLPLMAASRRLSKGKVQEKGAKVELSIHPALNFLFKGVLAVEIFLIRLGLRLPLGGSLLLAARKT